MSFQTKRTLSILSCKDLTYESVKPVLNTSAWYEPNLESPPFSINVAKEVTANLINLSKEVQNPKYHYNPNKPVIMLGTFMKAFNVDSVRDSSLEDYNSPKTKLQTYQ